MRCKDCEACVKGYFKHNPTKYVCIGVPDPFVIGDINSECIEYLDKNEDDVNEEIWSWNELDDEEWRHGVFNSREEAIEDALMNIEDIKEYLSTDVPVIYLGRCEYAPLPTDVDSERILWELDEQYCSETGCDYYIYEEITDKQTKWLEDRLSELITEFHNMAGLKPNWFNVVEQEKINLLEYKN